MHTKVNRLTGWYFTKQAQQSFWKHKTNAYFLTLQGHQKLSKQNLTPGWTSSEIFIKRPFVSWWLGWVVRLHPCPNQVMHVVTLKTSEGTLKFPDWSHSLNYLSHRYLLITWAILFCFIPTVIILWIVAPSGGRK